MTLAKGCIIDILHQRLWRGFMNLRQLVIQQEQDSSINVLSKLERALGREFSEEETLKILLNAYKHFSGQAADHMAVHLGLDKILSQEEMDKIYSFEANVEQKDR